MRNVLTHPLFLSLLWPALENPRESTDIPPATVPLPVTEDTPKLLLSEGEKDEVSVD